MPSFINVEPCGKHLVSETTSRMKKETGSTNDGRDRVSEIISSWLG